MIEINTLHAYDKADDDKVKETNFYYNFVVNLYILILGIFLGVVSNLVADNLDSIFGFSKSELFSLGVSFLVLIIIVFGVHIYWMKNKIKMLEDERAALADKATDHLQNMRVNYRTN